MTSTISKMIRPSLFSGIDVVVLFEDTFKEVHADRLELDIKAVDLYPEGYDLNTLSVGYKERKLNHDLERGSKKALKNVAADIRKKLGEKYDHQNAKKPL